MRLLPPRCFRSISLKKTIRDLIAASAERARASGALAFDTIPAFEVEATKHAEHGA